MAKSRTKPVTVQAEESAPPAVPAIVPRHQWMHTGAEVMILKCVAKDGSTYGGFQWPLTVGADVEAPDWNPVADCGQGLHGWPWGFAIGDGKEPEWAATWLVFGALPTDVVDLGGKVKAKRGTVRYVGDWHGAMEFVLKGQMAWVHQAAQGNERATGDSSASSATGDSSASSATGDRSASSATGDRSASSATGDSSASSATGYRSASSATGDSSASSATGDRSASSATGAASIAAVTGLYGKAQCGPFGVLALAFYNDAANRAEMRCARVGVGDGSDGLLKARAWYVLDAAGEFQEAK